MSYSVGEDIKPIKVRIYHFMGWTLAISGYGVNIWNSGL